VPRFVNFDLMGNGLPAAPVPHGGEALGGQASAHAAPARRLGLLQPRLGWRRHGSGARSVHVATINRCSFA